MRRRAAWVFVGALLVSATGPGGWMGPRPALADAETLTGKAVVLAAPNPSAAALGIFDPGTVVSVDGPPQGAYYPVSVDGLTGWVPGALLSVPQDAPASGPVSTSSARGASGEGGAPAPAPKDRAGKKTDRTTDATTPPADSTADATTTAQDAPPTEPPVAPTATGQLTQETTAAPAGTDAPEQFDQPSPTAAAPTADPSPPSATTSASMSAPAATAPDSGATAADEAETPAAAPPAGTVAPAAAPPTDAAPSAMATTSAATVAAGTPVPTAAAAVAEPTAAPSPSPEPTPSLDLNGDASVTTDVDLRSDANDNSDTVFRVPSGSTVHLTGQEQNGYVSAEFMWMYGWLPLWAVVPAPPVAAEQATPDPNVDVQTPKAGSGLAFTTTDLTMRSGPSANDDSMTTIPAGSKVTLTGVWQNGFQRVTYGDEVGWVSNDYLQTPSDPTPATKSNGKPQYSHDQIVKIIYAAADRYGQSRSDMLKVATCESNLDPYAVNPSGSYGLFQFIRSTWQSTPYGNQDIFDPRANANAAGWMWQQGRKDEWVCK